METVTTLGRNGLQDWLIQRISAVILGLYTLFLLYIFLFQAMSFNSWKLLFSSPYMKIASLLALISLSAHAWIGIWVVSTDYIKWSAIRLIFQLIVMVGLFTCFVWGVQILLF